MLPGIMNQLGPDNINHLKQIADSMSASTVANLSTPRATQGDTNDDDVPDLVANFEDISKM